jgi:hypothetical protein
MRLALAAALLVAPVQALAQAAVPIDPARQAVAEKVVASLVPNGIYGRIMRDQFPKMMDMMMARMSGMSPADIGQKGDGTIGEAARKQDPHFDERMRIMTRVMGEEMGGIFDKMEPRIRAGLARAFARRFTLQQLADMNAFFATPSGAAFANDYLLTFMDPELMQEMIGLMPEMLKAMPAMMAKVEKATADLPPPPKKDAK